MIICLCNVDMLVPLCCSIYRQHSTLLIMSSWWKFWKNDSDWKGKLMTGSAHISVTGSRLYVLELRDLLNSFWPAVSRKDQCSGQNLSWPTPKMWPKFSNYTKCNIICTPTTCSRMLIQSRQSSLRSSRNSRTVQLLSVTGVDRRDCNWMQRKQNACTSVLPSISQKIPDHVKRFSIRNETVEPVSVVRNLGVLFDEHLSMKAHISNISRTCFFHLRRLRSVRHQLGREITQQLVSAFVLSRLDYCNAVLAGLPDATLAPLQRVLNASARLILDLKPRDHVTSALKELHWLPIRQRSNTSSVFSSTCRSTTELRAIYATSWHLYRIVLVVHRCVPHRPEIWRSSNETETGWEGVPGRCSHCMEQIAGGHKMCNNNALFKRNSKRSCLNLRIFADCMYLRCWSTVNVRIYKWMIIIIYYYYWN